MGDHGRPLPPPVVGRCVDARDMPQNPAHCKTRTLALEFRDDREQAASLPTDSPRNVFRYSKISIHVIHDTG